MKTVDRCKTFKPTHSVLHYIDSMLAFLKDWEKLVLLFLTVWIYKT